MSIVGIAKEVSTILISSWYFGDKLSWINALGVGITVCGESEGFGLIFHLRFNLVSGIALFTHHKYRKSMESTVPLDAHGNPITDDDEIFAPIDSEEYGARVEETIRLTTTRDEELGMDEVCDLTKI
jgi:solute carrier family 35 protein C2